MQKIFLTASLSDAVFRGTIPMVSRRDFSNIELRNIIESDKISNIDMAIDNLRVTARESSPFYFTSPSSTS